MIGVSAENADEEAYQALKISGRCNPIEEQDHRAVEGGKTAEEIQRDAQRGENTAAVPSCRKRKHPNKKRRCNLKTQA